MTEFLCKMIWKVFLFCNNFLSTICSVDIKFYRIWLQNYLKFFYIFVIISCQKFCDLHTNFLLNFDWMSQILDSNYFKKINLLPKFLLISCYKFVKLSFNLAEFMAKTSLIFSNFLLIYHQKINGIPLPGSHKFLRKNFFSKIIIFV